MNADHSFVCWIQQLDEQYHITYESDPEIIWQYISSPTGTISIYPGTSQIECNDNNYLSVYNRPWYISGPKSILFMLDISSEIIKSFAKQIINLLTIYDFFGVVIISAHIKVLTGSTLIKASISNRQNIVILIDKLVSEENADYESGFYIAFDIIGSSKLVCSSTIIVLSDGILFNRESIYSVVSHRNIYDVIIHTIVFGQEKQGSDNRGIFVTISDQQEVSYGIKQLLLYFASMYNGNNSVVWTEPYEDIWGAGKIVTASRAVFFNNTLISIVNIDVPFSVFEDYDIGSLINKNRDCYYFNTDPCLDCSYTTTPFSRKVQYCNYQEKGLSKEEYYEITCSNENCGLMIGGLSMVSISGIIIHLLRTIKIRNNDQLPAYSEQM
jgi:hypothetical protein